MNLLGRLLDRSILFSFDKSGFHRHRRDFEDPDLDIDLGGRTFLVTGANSGLGLAAARGLAARGGTVRMLCRSLERGQRARDEIRAATGSTDVHVDEIDLADNSSVRTFGDRFAGQPADVLVHNVGLLPTERTTSDDGLELTAAVHVVGPLLLTRLLLPSLLASDDGRVIWVSSGGMYGARLSVRRMLEPPEPYDGVKAYAVTKRAQVVLAEMLSERLAPHGVTVNSMHPGWAATPGVERSLPRFQRLLGNRLGFALTIHGQQTFRLFL